MGRGGERLLKYVVCRAFSSVCDAVAVSWVTGVGGVEIIVFMFTMYITVDCS
jgi:hypothetical protein